jgi:hypothetical protein
MTTADQRAETTESAERPGSSIKTAGSTEGTGSPSPTTGSSIADSSTMARESVTERTDSSADESLFAEGKRSSLRSRWDEVQSGFVDDPRECVHKADGLVSDVVDQLTAGFSEARSRLEEQWARGEEVSTEDLRLTLKRYREFFERLLAV